MCYKNLYNLYVFEGEYGVFIVIVFKVILVIKFVFFFDIFVIKGY